MFRARVVVPGEIQKRLAIDSMVRLDFHAESEYAVNLARARFLGPWAIPPQEIGGQGSPVSRRALPRLSRLLHRFVHGRCGIESPEPRRKTNV